MLKPAILYKDELEKQFAKYLYTEKYFLYSGYSGCNELPSIKTQDDYFQFAILTPKPYAVSQVTGYLAYHIDPITDTVDRFGLFSFKLNNVHLAKDVYDKLDELINSHRRIEWRAIGGNPAIRSYDRVIKKYNGNKVVLHAVTKDLSGNWRDEHIYEVVNS